MFAEAVIARRPGAQINKLEHHWLEGLWVGRDGSTDEHLVASGGGIVRCRAVKRMTEDRRWLAARFGSFQWTPWAPSAVQRGRPPKARGDAEPIPMGALGREHLLMAPPAVAPAAASAAAPAAVAEPSVPVATEASPAQFKLKLVFVFFVIFLAGNTSGNATAGSGNDRLCCRTKT